MEVEIFWKVSQLKAKAKELLTNLNKEQIVTLKLADGKYLKDEDHLIHYHIKDNCTLHCNAKINVIVNVVGRGKIYDAYCLIGLYEKSEFSEIFLCWDFAC